MDAQDLENESFFRADEQRRKGFPSEAKVKRGVRIVKGHKELTEKLGRNDFVPAGQASVSAAAALSRADFDGIIGITTFRE